jgi:hypothetical protein
MLRSQKVADAKNPKIGQMPKSKNQVDAKNTETRPMSNSRNQADAKIQKLGRCCDPRTRPMPIFNKNIADAKIQKAGRCCNPRVRPIQQSNSSSSTGLSWAYIQKPPVTRSQQTILMTSSMKVFCEGTGFSTSKRTLVICVVFAFVRDAVVGRLGD